MSKYIEELMSPQLMMVVYVFIAFVVALYLLSVAYVFIDAKRRGVQAFWAWGLLALIPFVGLIAYLVMRPSMYASDREEQELEMALQEAARGSLESLPVLPYSHPIGASAPHVAHGVSCRAPIRTRHRIPMAGALSNGGANRGEVGLRMTSSFGNASPYENGYT